MNKELIQWIQESSQIDISSEKIKNSSSEKIEGKCHVCGQKTGKALCVKCGKPVCTAHYFHLVGLCKKCLAKETGEKWKGLKPDWEKTLGVEWID